MSAQKYDDVLMPFLTLMRRELHTNSGKGDRPGWLAMNANQALLEVYYHLAKLQKAVRDNDGPGILEYGADVANMAMMVVDICGGLAWVDNLPAAAATPALKAFLSHCPWCGEPSSVAEEAYCANSNCRWNNGGTEPPAAP
jgi:hypothetical protein